MKCEVALKIKLYQIRKNVKDVVYLMIIMIIKRDNLATARNIVVVTVT